MKRFLIIVSTALCLFASCQKEQIDSTTSEMGLSYTITSSYTMTHSELVSYAAQQIITTFQSFGMVESDGAEKYQKILQGILRTRRFELCKDSLGKNLHYHIYNVQYTGQDPQGNPTPLSGCIVIPCRKNTNPDKILIYNYNVAFAGVFDPSEVLQFESLLAADNNVCIFPDFYGNGCSSGTHPYMAYQYNAQAAVGLFDVAMDIMKKNDMELAEDYYTWTTGYSQSGGQSLGIQKYIESCLPQEKQDLINLKWSFNGGGPYNPNVCMDSLITLDSTQLSSVMLLPISSLFIAHPDKMQGLSYEDILSPRAVEAGLADALRKDHNLLSIARTLVNCLPDCWWSPVDIFHPDMYDTTSATYKQVQKALMSDYLAGGWAPKAKIALFHDSQDELIPYSVTQDVLNNFGQCKVTVHSPALHLGHLGTILLYWIDLFSYSEPTLYRQYFK